jgi:hypothetical protein
MSLSMINNKTLIAEVKKIIFLFLFYNKIFMMHVSTVSDD